MAGGVASDTPPARLLQPKMGWLNLSCVMYANGKSNACSPSSVIVGAMNTRRTSVSHSVPVAVHLQQMIQFSLTRNPHQDTGASRASASFLALSASYVDR